jgi:hypothetical protein
VVNQTQAKSSEVESAFMPIFTEYGNIFDSIDKKLQSFEKD